MNVFVVVSDEREKHAPGVLGMKPFIADNMSEAVAMYEMSGMDLNDIVGVFTYGKHELLVDAIKEAME